MFGPAKALISLRFCRIHFQIWNEMCAANCFVFPTQIRDTRLQVAENVRLVLIYQLSEFRLAQKLQKLCPTAVNLCGKSKPAKGTKHDFKWNPDGTAPCYGSLNLLMIFVNIPKGWSKMLNFKSSRALARLCFFAVLVATLAFLASATFAQTTVATGSIVGTVTDPSGALVDGARVVITNIDTNRQISLTSNATGSFNSGALAPGNYRCQRTRIE